MRTMGKKLEEFSHTPEARKIIIEKWRKAVTMTRSFSKFVYRIIDNKGRSQGVYSRAYHDEYDFDSAERARNSNVHGIYTDKTKYKIAKYRVDYILINEDCDE